MNIKLIAVAVSAILLSVACSNKKDIDIPDVNKWNPADTLKSGTFYRGVTMTVVEYLERVGDAVYKENGMAKDPYKSVKDHGGNMIRLLLEPEAFENTAAMNAVGAPTVDWGTMERVKAGMLRAKAAELDVVLTLKPEKSFARCWNDATTREELGDILFDWCYATLEELYAQNTLPAIVAIGNEINAWFMVPESYMQEGSYQYDYEANVYFVNRGLAAVKAFNEARGTQIKTACHIFSPSHIKWWFTEHYDKGLTDFDILALSWYIDYQGHTMGEWNNFAEIVRWLKTKGKDFLVLEASYPYTLKNADSQANVYNAGLSSEDATSPAIQRRFLKNLALELYNAGAIGMITWGNESLPTEAYIYANDDWGKGSSWDNNSYWDADCNLHEGIDWMGDIEK